MRYINCKQVFLFGLDFTESPSTLNWTERSVNSWKGTVIPQTFAELDKIPLERSYKFLMLLDKDSIDKEVSILGIEAHMFWEQETVRNDFNAFCKKWFFSDHKAYMQTAVDVSSESPPQDVTITNANIDTTSPSVVIVDSLSLIHI